MSELRAVQCEACGGAVAFVAGEPAPRCVFCGAGQLVVHAAPEGVESPRFFLPFTIDEAGARAAFRRFAKRSIWYPGDLAQSKLNLAAVLVPAWTWAGAIETHWTALVRDSSTRSDRRPETGNDRFEAEGVLIAASPTLSRAELDGISPFSAAEVRPVAEAREPHELGSLTRTAAHQAATDGFLTLHTAELEARVSPVRMKTSAVVLRMEGSPVLLPVWIGAYRRGDRLFRVVLNGQSGALVGKAPISWAKVGCAIFVVLALLALLATFGGGVALWEVGYRPMVPRLP